MSNSTPCAASVRAKPPPVKSIMIGESHGFGAFPSWPLPNFITGGLSGSQGGTEQLLLVMQLGVGVGVGAFSGSGSEAQVVCTSTGGAELHTCVAFVLIETD